MSLLLRPPLQTNQFNWITMATTLGAAEAVEMSSNLTVGIKWPNDLVLHGRKLAGVLAESAFSGQRLEYAVVGLGLNVNIDFAEHPGLSEVATSLRAELARAVDMTSLLATILARMEHHYLALKQGLSPQPAWARRLITLGQLVTATRADGSTISGIAEQVFPDGALRIRLQDERLELLQAGDVTLRESI
jgi:BirA family biotin operon repressor/biotin-[acetyl-CoA-carboxylase] ligase